MPKQISKRAGWGPAGKCGRPIWAPTMSRGRRISSSGHIMRDARRYTILRDVVAVGVDAAATAIGNWFGKNWSLGVEEWSSTGRNNRPNQPCFRTTAAWNAGRSGLAAGTLGISEIIIGTYDFSRTGDADAYQQHAGGVAAGNLAAAAGIKIAGKLRGMRAPSVPELPPGGTPKPPLGGTAGRSNNPTWIREPPLGSGKPPIVGPQPSLPGRGWLGPLEPPDVPPSFSPGPPFSPN